MSSLGDSVQYFYNWGNVNTGWVSTLSYTKAWAVAGTYQVKVQARCFIHPSILSAWSTPLTVVISPVVVGELGTKTNSIPLNKDMNQNNIYFPSTGGGDGGSTITVGGFGGGKTYFLVDTSFCKNQPVSSFTVIIKGYNNTNLYYSKIPQDKAGNDLAAEIPIANYMGDGLDMVVNNQSYGFSTTRWLYAIDNIGVSFPIDINVQFVK